MRELPLRSAALLLAASLLAAGCASEAAETEVAAAVSLRGAFLDIAETFQTRYPDRRLRFAFAGSGALLAQIEQGAPFDAVALAGAEEMDRLEQGGRLEPGSRFDFAGNRLVVAVPLGEAMPASLDDLRGERFRRIALGAPAAVPAGRYARQALLGAGLWEALQPRLIFAEHVAQVRTYVARGEVDAGFLYRSDLEGADDVQGAFEVDPSLHAPIRYPAAALKGARDPEGARLFLEMLGGTLGEVMLRRHGFGPPPLGAPGEAPGRAGGRDDR